jgi:hypothetical protein
LFYTALDQKALHFVGIRDYRELLSGVFKRNSDAIEQLGRHPTALAHETQQNISGIDFSGRVPVVSSLAFFHGVLGGRAGKSEAAAARTGTGSRWSKCPGNQASLEELPIAPNVRLRCQNQGRPALSSHEPMVKLVGLSATAPFFPTERLNAIEAQARQSCKRREHGRWIVLRRNLK